MSRFIALKRNRADVACLFERGYLYSFWRGIAELPQPREEFFIGESFAFQCFVVHTSIHNQRPGTTTHDSANAGGAGAGHGEELVRTEYGGDEHERVKDALAERRRLQYDTDGNEDH